MGWSLVLGLGCAPEVEPERGEATAGGGDGSATGSVPDTFFRLDFQGAVGIEELELSRTAGEARFRGQAIDQSGNADHLAIWEAYRRLPIGAVWVGGEDDGHLRLSTVGGGLLLEGETRLLVYQTRTEIPLATFQSALAEGGAKVPFAATALTETEVDPETWAVPHSCPLATADDPAKGWLIVGEADGSTPGTSRGRPTHPPGSHSMGNDVDVGYYQTPFMPDNEVRPVCPHLWGGNESWRCLAEPDRLDVRPTALFTALVAEQEVIRCIGVDGVIGPLLRQAQFDLYEEGVLTRAQLEADKLCYETEDRGRGWFRSHHDHIHISAY